MSRRTPESPVVEGVMDFLEAVDGHKVIVFRRQAGGLSYKKGLPDVYATVDGIHVEVECKAPAGASPTQLRWQRKFVEAGVLYVRPKSTEEFKRWFFDVFG